jgi:hypothetical protein
MTRNKYISHDGFHLILIIYKYLFVPPLFQDKLIPPNNNIVSKLNNNKFYFLYFTVILIVKKSIPLSFPLQISFRIVFALKSHTHLILPKSLSKSSQNLSFLSTLLWLNCSSSWTPIGLWFLYDWNLSLWLSSKFLAFSYVF